jgi:hypothetical protein
MGCCFRRDDKEAWQDAANRMWNCPKFADDFAAKSADNAADFRARPAGCFPEGDLPREDIS